MKIDLTKKPTTPPPDPNQPWVWLGDQWYLMAQDSADGVPASLDDLPGAQGNTE